MLRIMDMLFARTGHSRPSCELIFDKYVPVFGWASWSQTDSTETFLFRHVFFFKKNVLGL